MPCNCNAEHATGEAGYWRGFHGLSSPLHSLQASQAAEEKREEKVASPAQLQQKHDASTFAEACDQALGTLQQAQNKVRSEKLAFSQSDNCGKGRYLPCTLQALNAAKPNPI